MDPSAAASAPISTGSAGTIETLAKFITAALGQIAAGVLLPAALFVILMGVAFWVIWLAQKRGDFDIADLLRSYHAETQSWRVDTAKFATLMAFSVHSAYFYATLWSSTPQKEFFVWYGIIWAGSPAAMELASAAKQWNGQLPFVKGPPA